MLSLGSIKREVGAISLPKVENELNQADDAMRMEMLVEMDFVFCRLSKDEF